MAVVASIGIGVGWCRLVCTVRSLWHSRRHDAHGHGVAQQAAQDQREDQQTGQEGAHGSVGER